MRIYFKYCLPLFFLSLLFPEVVNSQEKCNRRISGTIIDESTGKGIAFANIVIDNGNLGTSTDHEGNFIIESVCNQEYAVQVIHLSYLKIDTTLIPGEKIRVKLKANSVNLEDVTVKGQKEINTTQTIKTLSGKELNSTRGKALGEALKGVSGLTSINTGATVSKPVIHGLHSNRILILNNGVRLEGQQWSKDASPEIDPFVASNITVLQGANSVRYGADAMGGVILVEAPPLRKEPGIEGDVNYVHFDNNKQNVFSGSIGGNFNAIIPISLRVQGTHNRAGNSKTAHYYLDNTGAKEQNFSYAIGSFHENFGGEIYYSQYNASIGIYRGSHIDNLRDMIKIFQGQVIDTTGFDYEIDRPRQNVTHELFKANGYYNFNESNSLKLTFSRQFNRRDEYDVYHGINKLPEGEGPQLSHKLTTHILDLDLNLQHRKNLKSLVGGNFIKKKNTNTSSFFLPKSNSHAYGIFWIPRWEKDQLSLESGLRFDTEQRTIKSRSPKDSIETDNTYKSVSANLGGSYLFLKNFSANINFGIAWRPPSVVELYTNGLNHGDAAYEIGDPNMTPERLYSSMVAIEYSKDRFFDFGVSVFKKHFKGYIYQEPAGKVIITIRGLFPAFRYAQADVNMNGLDYHLDFTYIKNLRLRHRGSIIRAINKKTGRYISLIPPDHFEYSAKYTVGNFKSLKNVYGEFSYHHHNRQTRFDDKLELKETPPPRPYDLVNIETGFTVVINKQPLIIGLSLNNAFNELYRSYMNRLRYYADDVGRNFSVRLRVPFEIKFNKDVPIN